MPSLTDMPRPAQEMGSDREFAVSEWKAYTKNTLRGFMAITTPSGMVLHGCTLHEKGESRWIGLPAQKFVKDDGTASYTPVVEFISKETRDRFNAAALRAVDKMLGGQQ